MIVRVQVFKLASLCGSIYSRRYALLSVSYWLYNVINMIAAVSDLCPLRFLHCFKGWPSGPTVDDDFNFEFIDFGMYSGNHRILTPPPAKKTTQIQNDI